MEESLLIKISLIMSLVGIILLFLISNKIKVKEYPVNLLSKELLENHVTVTGIVTNLKESPKFLFLTIEDKNKDIIKVLLDNKKGIRLRKGLEIKVTGKLKVYQKEFEIEASEIKIL